MGRSATSLVALLLVIVACTDAASGDTTTTSRASTAAPTTTPATNPGVTDPGQLAVIDGNGDIAVMEPDGSNVETLTDRGENPVIYMQPIWSPDGSRLAWGQATGTGFGVGIGDLAGGDVMTLTTPNLPFYTYWSPDGRHLGALHNGETGVQFQIVDVDGRTTSLLDEDAPFYFSWSPDGDRVVTHAGTGRVETITPSDERTRLAPTTGNYLAPQWTDSGIFHVAGEHLVLEDADQSREPLLLVGGLVTFVANPQGTLVAVQSVGDDLDGMTAATDEVPQATSNVVMVVDVASGETSQVGDDPALGFFWSPDGESLLVLTPSEREVVPSVWSAEGDLREYSPYVPHPTMLQDTFPFFPQYAQSVRFWSPDSTAFAYAGAVGDETGIWVQSLIQPEATLVSDGSWVAWSPAG